ncbi:hypothetical protein E2C01_092925 [Portunus trituberculatus]|uniref:Secreted protein n=1 Tax=Portunus trituberculatus TaxID=210409 RepID=A0A5B7JSP8_PORTR|nr:hypothetical protein [Portunus trituberculatus]
MELLITFISLFIFFRTSVRDALITRHFSRYFYARVFHVLFPAQRGVHQSRLAITVLMSPGPRPAPDRLTQNKSCQRSRMAASRQRCQDVRGTRWWQPMINIFTGASVTATALQGP